MGGVPRKRVGTETSLKVFSIGSSVKSSAHPPIDMVYVLFVSGPVKTSDDLENESYKCVAFYLRLRECYLLRKVLFSFRGEPLRRPS